MGTSIPLDTMLPYPNHPHPSNQHPKVLIFLSMLMSIHEFSWRNKKNTSFDAPFI